MEGIGTTAGTQARLPAGAQEPWQKHATLATKIVYISRVEAMHDCSVNTIPMLKFTGNSSNVSAGMHGSLSVKNCSRQRISSIISVEIHGNSKRKHIVPQQFENMYVRRNPF